MTNQEAQRIARRIVQQLEAEGLTLDDADGRVLELIEDASTNADEFDIIEAAVYA